MVIRLDDSGVSSLKKCKGVAVAPARIWLCLLESMWTDSVIFQWGSNEGILEMADRIAQGSSGAKPSRGSQVLCLSEAESGGWLKIREGCAPKKDIAIVV